MVYHVADHPDFYYIYKFYRYNKTISICYRRASQVTDTYCFAVLIYCLYVEEEMHDVTILNNIFLTFYSKLSCSTACSL